MCTNNVKNPRSDCKAVCPSVLRVNCFSKAEKYIWIVRETVVVYEPLTREGMFLPVFVLAQTRGIDQLYEICIFRCLGLVCKTLYKLPFYNTV